MPKHILLIGAGKSATVLIDYLINEAEENEWIISIADANKEMIDQKIAGRKQAIGVTLDIHDSTNRKRLISSADLVISMMPPALHILIANDCLEFGKHLLTASYVDEAIKSMHAEATEKGLIFLCEMGLDPGIDHMSAMKIMDGIKSEGGKIISFKSHCGGLVAPESDDNPWHYKISWNPRNVVLAGKAGAVYLENGAEIRKEYESLFKEKHLVDIYDEKPFHLAYYPNRNSLGYTELYDLKDVHTFIRTTLRYPEFMSGWSHIISLALTDEEVVYDTTGMSLQDFFETHLIKKGLQHWLDEYLDAKFIQVNHVIDSILNQLKELSLSSPENGNRRLLIQKAQQLMAQNLHEANLMLQQLLYLGMKDRETIINKGLCSAADVLQFILEKKWTLGPADKDMIVMLHEIEYTSGVSYKKMKSSLIVKGEDSLKTAMAKTVGMPLGIAAKLILSGKIKDTGVVIPFSQTIYEPVLAELEKFGIRFQDRETSNE